MSAKHVFSGSADELYDTKVREVLVSLTDPAALMIGLRVDVLIDADTAQLAQIQAELRDSSPPVTSSVGAGL
jgi:hypothetical protein